MMVESSGLGKSSIRIRRVPTKGFSVSNSLGWKISRVVGGAARADGLMSSKLVDGEQGWSV